MCCYHTSSRVFAEIVDTFATLMNVTHGPCAGVGNLWAEVNYGNWALLWRLGIIMALGFIMALGVIMAA